MEFKLSIKQAERMADAIVCAKLFMCGIGHFDINKEELAEVLVAAFGKKRYLNCEKVYSKLYDKKMR